LFDKEENLIKDGNYKIKFILYENAFGGVGLWEESHDIVIKSGLISVVLGSINPITISEKINYLEIQIEDQILLPRQELTSVVYSFHSNTSIKSIKSDTSNFSIKSIKSDTSNFSLNSNSSVITSSLLLGTSSISLPSADGSSGQVLSTNGSGSLSWSTVNNNNNSASSLNDLNDASVGSGSKLVSSTGVGEAQYNVGLGYEVFNSINSGDYNTAIGSNTLGKLTSGSDNTTIGRDAAENMTTGSNNIIIGSEADPSSNNAVNQIVIGKGAVGHGDNITVIGNGSQTAIHPHDDNEVDLGSSSYSFKDIYLDGTINSSGENIDDGFAKRIFYSNNNVVEDPGINILTGVSQGILIEGIVLREEVVEKCTIAIDTPPSGTNRGSANGVTFRLNSNGVLSVSQPGNFTVSKVAANFIYF